MLRINNLHSFEDGFYCHSSNRFVFHFPCVNNYLSPLTWWSPQADSFPDYICATFYICAASVLHYIIQNLYLCYTCATPVLILHTTQTNVVNMSNAMEFTKMHLLYNSIIVYFGANKSFLSAEHKKYWKWTRLFGSMLCTGCFLHLASPLKIPSTKKLI